jgi:predicted GNAT family acetyltransferase
MKKTVLTFGLICGALLSLMMLGTVPFLDKIGFDKGEVIGYTSMVLSFLLVFFGIRSYRENVGNGAITFGRAFSVGILITLAGCLCYVVTWEIIYFKLAPGFADKYTTYIVEKLRSSGASQQMIEAKAQEMKNFKAMYDNPLINSAISFLEPLPVGLIMTLISAAILRKKPRSNDQEEVVTPVFSS